MCSCRQSTYTRKDREKGNHRVDNQKTQKERGRNTQSKQSTSTKREIDRKD